MPDTTADRVRQIIAQWLPRDTVSDDEFLADFVFDDDDKFDLLKCVADDFGIEITAAAADVIHTVGDAVRVVDELLAIRAGAETDALPQAQPCLDFATLNRMNGLEREWKLMSVDLNDERTLRLKAEERADRYREALNRTLNITAEALGQLEYAA